MGLRTFLTYMFTHPGKKLTFMGSEFAQFDEWDNASGLQFNLLVYDKHMATKQFVTGLNHFYKNNPELYEIDFDWKGFRWIVVDDKNSNVLAYARRAKNGEELICAFNFSLAMRKNYKLNVPPGLYQEVFTTTYPSNKKPRTYNDAKGKSFINVDLPPLSAIILKKTLNEWTVGNI